MIKCLGGAQAGHEQQWLGLGLGHSWEAEYRPGKETIPSTLREAGPACTVSTLGPHVLMAWKSWSRFRGGQLGGGQVWKPSPVRSEKGRAKRQEGLRHWRG